MPPSTARSSYPAHLIDEFAWETDLPVAPDFRGNKNARRIVKEPMGVVGAIVPWNYPFEVSVTKLAQALATGNTVVLKPAPDTPWNATLLGRVVAENTDIPPGVLNVVTSSDHLVGEELTLSPEVDLISFTGSTAVGKRIMEKGAATLKRLFLELGGKSATIVLDDADFPTAMMTGLAVCSHAGQGCAIPTRMLLPRSRYEEGVAILTSMFASVPYGDPQRPDVIMGPLISEKQRDRVLGYIERGVTEGATLAVEGVAQAISLGVGTWSRPCSPRSTIPWRSPGRRSSDRCWSSWRSMTMTMPSGSPTTAATDWAGRSSPARWSAPWPSRPASARAS